MNWPGVRLLRCNMPTHLSLYNIGYMSRQNENVAHVADEKWGSRYLSNPFFTLISYVPCQDRPFLLLPMSFRHFESYEHTHRRPQRPMFHLSPIWVSQWAILSWLVAMFRVVKRMNPWVFQLQPSELRLIMPWQNGKHPIENQDDDSAMIRTDEFERRKRWRSATMPPVMWPHVRWTAAIVCIVTDGIAYSCCSLSRWTWCYTWIALMWGVWGKKRIVLLLWETRKKTRRYFRKKKIPAVTSDHNTPELARRMTIKTAGRSSRKFLPWYHSFNYGKKLGNQFSGKAKSRRTLWEKRVCNANS